MGVGICIIESCERMWKSLGWRPWHSILHQDRNQKGDMTRNLREYHMERNAQLLGAMNMRIARWIGNDGIGDE